MPKHLRVFASAIFVILTFVWFASLTSRDLIRTDEGRYASIAREMATSGDFISPTLNQLKYFYKPPLQYWATAIAFSTFGETPLAARLWGGITTFFAILGTGYVLLRLSTREVALAGMGIHASLLWVFSLAHINTLDAALAAFLHLTLCGVLLAHQRQIDYARRTRWWMFATAMMALAVLSKGLIGLLIPVAVMGLYTFISRDWSLLKSPPWGRSLVIFFAITAPWFILVGLRNAEFHEFFFINEHLRRYTSNVHRRVGSWWYFIPLLIAGLIPWLGIALAAISPRARTYAREAFASTLKVTRILLIWCVFIFLFFSASGSKLPSYILPMFGAIALLLAPIALRLSHGTFQLSMGVNALIGTALAIASTPSLVVRMNAGVEGRLLLAIEMSQWFRISAVCLILTFVAAWLWRANGERIKGILAVSLLSIFAAWAGLMGHNALSPAQSGRSLAHGFVEKHGWPAADIPFFSVKSFDHTLPFYLRHSFIVVEYRDELELGLQSQPDRYLKDEDAFVKVWSTLPKGYAVMTHEVLESVRTKSFTYREVSRDVRRVIVSRP